MKKTCISIALASLILGCGGGGGDSTSSSHNNNKATKAYLVDSPMQGATYVVDRRQYQTGLGGVFWYDGGDISFYIGNIKLGTINSLPKDHIVTLQDILHIDRDDLSNPKLLKLATFIQSIDNDKNTNTIEVNGDKFRTKYYQKDAVNLNLNDILQSKGISVKNELEVKEHLNNSYVKIIKSQNLPTIKQTYPANEQTNVDLNPIIKIYFEKPMPFDMFSKKSISLADKDRRPVDTKIYIKDDLVTIKPVNILASNQKYRIILSKDIADYQNRKLGDYSFYFYTGSNVASNNIITNDFHEVDSTSGASSHKSQQSTTTQEKQKEPNVSSGGLSHKKDYNDTSKTPVKKPYDDSEKVDNKKPQGDIIHKGFAYNLITSPITGRVWLDRNLGAYKVCDGKDDEKCFGDFFQWGRKANGHEKKDSEVMDLGYEGLFDKDVESGGKFGTWKDDWRKTKTLNPWDGVNGENNPCPSGFRVPSMSEILVETKDVDKEEFPSQVLDGQYTNLSNFLKLPNNGWRKSSTRDGILESQGYNGRIWSSELNDNNSMARVFDFFPGGSFNTLKTITQGNGVRCIKDYNKKAITSPEVVNSSPADGETDVVVNKKFTITFSKQVPSSEVEYQRDKFIVKNDATGAIAPVSIIRVISPNKISFTLSKYNSNASGGLEYDSDYTLSVLNVKDSSGVLMKPYSIKFHTQKRR